ncbi:MAG: hypothetical protein ACHQ01_08485 [Candidatus Limnocylindrales bacterium]
MDNALRVCPRLVGANLGALAGLLVSVSGFLVFSSSGVATGFVIIGFLMAIVALFAGFAITPVALLGRWRMLGSGVLIAVIAILGTVVILVALTLLMQPDDLSTLPGEVAEWFVGVGVMVGVAWVILLRAVRAGSRLRAAFALATALGLVWVAALIESRLWWA